MDLWNLPTLFSLGPELPFSSLSKVKVETGSRKKGKCPRRVKQGGANEIRGEFINLLYEGKVSGGKDRKTAVNRLTVQQWIMKGAKVKAERQLPAVFDCRLMCLWLGLSLAGKQHWKLNSNLIDTWNSDSTGKTWRHSMSDDHYIAFLREGAALFSPDLNPCIHFWPPLFFLLFFLFLFFTFVCNLTLVYSCGGWAEYRLAVKGLMACYYCLETAVKRRRRREAGKRGTGAPEVGFVLFFGISDSWSGIGSETMTKEPLNRSWGCVTPAVSGRPRTRAPLKQLVRCRIQDILAENVLHTGPDSCVNVSRHKAPPLSRRSCKIGCCLDAAEQNNPAAPETGVDKQWASLMVLNFSTLHQAPREAWCVRYHEKDPTHTCTHERAWNSKTSDSNYFTQTAKSNTLSSTWAQLRQCGQCCIIKMEMSPVCPLTTFTYFLSTQYPFLGPLFYFFFLMRKKETSGEPLTENQWQPVSFFFNFSCH